MGQTKDNRLSCEEIEELVPDLLYGELDPEREAEVRARLPECELSDKVASYERLRAALRSLPDEEPPPAISAQLMHAAAQHVEGARRAADRPGIWERLRAWVGPIGMHPGLAAAASLVLVAGVAGLLYMRGADHPVGPKAPTNAAAPAGDTAIALPTAPPASAAAPEQEESGRGELDRGVTGELDEFGDVLSKDNEAGPAPTGGGAKGGTRGLESAKRARGDKASAPSRRGGSKLDVASDGTGLLGGMAGDADEDQGQSANDDAYRAPAETVTDKSVKAEEKPRAEPQPAATPADEPAAAEAPPPPPPAKQRKTKKKSASSSELKKLHAEAVAAAKAGDCARVRALSARIESLDGSYYNEVFRKDSAIRACDGVRK